VLDDDAGRGVKSLDRFPCRVGVADVVVGELLALQLFVAGDAAGHGERLAIERGLLVRVLAIAHGVDLVEGQLQALGKVVGLLSASRLVSQLAMALS